VSGGAVEVWFVDDDGSLADDDEDDRSPGCAGGGERVKGCDGGAGGGDGKTVEIGGRVVPLTQLLEHTLNCAPQVCVH
jgi:hypothetical protein